MNKKLSKKNVICLGIIIIVFLVNLFLFANLISQTDDNSKVEKVNNTQINMSDNNEMLNKTITKQQAIEIAEEGLSKEVIPFEKQEAKVIKEEVITKYDYYSSDTPVPEAKWTIIFHNIYEDYVYIFPPEVVHKIDSLAIELGLVWSDDTGNTYGRYDYYEEFIICEVDALKGKYIGFEKLYVENKEEDILEGVEEKIYNKYGLDIINGN